MFVGCRLNSEIMKRAAGGRHEVGTCKSGTVVRCGSLSFFLHVFFSSLEKMRFRQQQAHMRARTLISAS